jgi:hypothetical protein
VYSFKNPRIGSICTRVRVTAGTPTHKKTKERILRMRGRVRVRAETPTQKDKIEYLRHA